MEENLKTKKINNNEFLSGEINIPPDKSISHRSLIFGAIASKDSNKKVEVKNLSLGEDCLSTLKILENVGVKFEFLSKRELIIDSKNAFEKEFLTPKSPLDCGNSGTSTRLLIGFFSGLKGFKGSFIGDNSLKKRPMKRIIEPLGLMGADIKSNENKLPIVVQGKNLKGITYFSPIPSAQVKSALLLAGLSADSSNNKTRVYEKTLSRNHSEIMFKYLGADISTGHDEKGFWAEIAPSKLIAKPIEVVGDISSAAFFMVAAAIVPNSKVLIKNVGINQTRTGILDIFKMVGADFEIKNERFVSGEPVADIEITYTENLKPFKIEGDIVPRLIDEIPVLAVLAAFIEGKSVVKDAFDLRNKESDRIKTIVDSFKKFGVEIVEKEDGFEITGKKGFKGKINSHAPKETITLETHLDHRLAMSYFILSLLCDNEIVVKGFSCVETSFPEFLELFKNLRKQA